MVHLCISFWIFHTHDTATGRPHNGIIFMFRGRKPYSFDAPALANLQSMYTVCLPFMIFQFVMLDFLPVMPQVLIPTHQTS